MKILYENKNIKFSSDWMMNDARMVFNGYGLCTDKKTKVLISSVLSYLKDNKYSQDNEKKKFVIS